MLIDAHAHLDRYGNSLAQALSEIEQDRIFTVANSMDPPSYERNLEIGGMCDLVLPTFGIHPKRAPEYAGRLKELSKAVDQSPMIGEIGLDFHWVRDPSHYPAQRKVLSYFLAAAGEQKKVVNLHTKGAEKEVLGLLERHEVARPIIHWYSGPLDILRSLIDYGAYFTVGIELVYSEAIREITRRLPPEKILTETDNPGGLQWLRGSSGMPRLIREVLRALAPLKQTTEEAMARAVRRNFFRLIEDDPWLTPVRDRLFDEGS